MLVERGDKGFRAGKGKRKKGNGAKDGKVKIKVKIGGATRERRGVGETLDKVSKVGLSSCRENAICINFNGIRSYALGRN